ncbi:MAG: hypothetical protein KKB51_05175 [Candidatus Riflebacteria bacterium]|nr:hypothetical protein [Candidatus Riflebacteria bacterium]
MSRFSKKSIACLLVLAILFQPIFAEVAVWAANTNAAEIARAKQEYQKTYEQIMSLETVDLGWFAGGVVDVVGKIESAVTKQEKDYIKEIEEANKQILQAKADAVETRNLINAGDLEAAAAKDPSQMANSLAESGGAMAKYQEAMTKAGYALTGVGNALSALGDFLTITCGVLTVVAIIAGTMTAGTLAVALAPVLAKLIPITNAISIAAGLLTAAGNSLISSAEKGIVDDANLLGNLGKDVAIEGVKIIVAQKLLPVVGNKIGKTLAKRISSTFSKTAANAFSKVWNPKKASTNGLSKILDFKSLYKNSVPKAGSQLYKNQSYLQRYTKHRDSKIFEGVIIDSVFRIGKLFMGKPIPGSTSGFAGTEINKGLSSLQSKPEKKSPVSGDKASGGGGASEINTPNESQKFKPRKNQTPGLNP